MIDHEDYQEHIERLFAEITILTDALVDISLVRLPGIPDGATISMQEFGPFARERAERALRDIDYYK